MRFCLSYATRHFDRTDYCMLCGDAECLVHSQLGVEGAVLSKISESSRHVDRAPREGNARRFASG